MKAVIFDLDGTLLDTLEDLYLSVNKALEKFNYPLRTLEEIRRFVGNGIRNLMTQACPEGIDDFEECLAYFKGYYTEHSLDNTKPYDDIIYVLRELNRMGVKCAIVSNKFDGAVKVMAEKYFPGLIAVAVGEREGVRRKPAPDTVIEVLNTLGITKDEAVFVGDSETDVETSQNAEMTCIAVTWGFRDKDLLKEKGARIFADTPLEMLDAIKDII